tara:strand:- start:6339 stop:7499 length:1161 start_codon:yes stop_codon:yes gene_type:complete
MEIKNEMLKKYLEDIENGEMTLQKIDTFGKEADFETLSELFDLIEQGSVDLHALKLYSIVYEPSLIAEVSTKKALNYVDMILAAMWRQEIEKENEKEIMYATLGFVIFGTDFVKRVKNGYKQLSYDLERLEEQIKNLVYLYVSEIENNSFIKSLSQDANIPSDSELLSLDMEELDSVKKIKSRIEFSKLAYEYENSESKEEKSRILEEAKLYNENEGDYHFLPAMCLNIFSDLKISNGISNADIDYIEDNENSSYGLLNNLSNTEDLSVEDDYEDLEILSDSNEGSLIKGFKNLVSSKTSPKKEGVKSKKVELHSVTMKSTAAKKTNSFKHTILMIFILAIIGLGFTAVTQKEKINGEESVAEKVVDSQVESKKLEINRSGTNEGE